MSNGEHDRHESDRDVLRTHRLEVVDDDGNLRGVIGEIEPPGRDGRSTFGMEFYAPTGEPRISAAMRAGRAWLMLELAGNARVHAGVNDASTEAVDETAFLYLTDADGAPVVGWRVRDDGTLEAHPSG